MDDKPEEYENPLDETPIDKKKNGKKVFALATLSLVFIILAAVWAGAWFLHFQYQESTDDAYVSGSIVNITSAVSGIPIAYYADATDYVKQGQLLVVFDDTDYELAYQRQLASLASTVLQVRQLYSAVEGYKANVEAKKTQLQKVGYVFDNRKRLVDSKAISNEEFTQAKDNFALAEIDLKQAQAQLQAAIAAVGNTSIEEHPMIEAQKLAVRQAYRNLQNARIYSPVTGYVAKRSVELGQFSSPNSFLMALVPSDNYWIDANFKETQLDNIRIGQPVKVYFDIYKDVEFEGKVVGISPGTGGVFSIIPPQNATGNWIKIVQRIPVRISVDPEKLKQYPIRLGISSKVIVDVSNKDLPLISSIPITSTPIRKTDIFEVNMQEVDKVIEKTIEDNLQ